MPNSRATKLEADKVVLLHAVALQFGGCDNGLPCERPNFGPNYYAAFVIDPDGYELEAKFFVS